MTHDPFPAQGGFPPAYIKPAGPVGGNATAARTAAYTVMGSSVLMTAALPALLYSGPEALLGPLAYVGAYAIYVGSLLFLYIAGNLWISRVREVVAAEGYPVPPTWKIWAAWFIPFYNLVGPYQVMRDITYKAGTEALKSKLAMWWGGWLGSGAVAYFASFSEDPAVAIPVDILGTGLALMSMWALLGLITEVTAAAEVPVMPRPPASPPPYLG